MRIKNLSRKFKTYAGLEFSYWMAIAAADYLVVLLQQNGFTSSQIGRLNAINSLVAIISGPLWGMLADRWRSPRKAFLLTMSAGSLLWALLPVSVHLHVPGIPLLAPFVIAAASTLFRTPANALQDTFIVQKCVIESVDYSAVRSFGSFSFAAFAIILSLALPLIGVESSFYIYALLTIPVVILMARQTDAGGGTPPSRAQHIVSQAKGIHLGTLFRNYYFVTFIIFAFLLYLANSVSYFFLPFLLHETGSDSSLYGLVSGFKAFVEIPVLLIMGRIRKRFSLPSGVRVSALLLALQFFLFAQAGGLAEILLWSVLQGLGGGLLIGAATNYVYALSPPDLTSTAQTVYASVCSLAGIIANIAGGAIIDNLGVRAFYHIIAADTLFALIFLGGTLAAGLTIFKKPLPGLALPMRINRTETSRSVSGCTL
jgi:PPP family 3-phenylpropionic acid transporter